MTWLRRLFWVLLVLGVIYTAFWVAGMFVIQAALDRLKAAPMSAIDELLAEELDDSPLRFSFEGRSVSGYPFGYKITLDKPSLDHPLVSWKAENRLTSRWSVFRPFTVNVDYGGTHSISSVLQPSVQLSTDRGRARVRVQPLLEKRDVRLSLVAVTGEIARFSLRDRPVFSIERFALGLDMAKEAEPGDMMMDVFGFALSEDPEVQARYQEALLLLGGVESTLSALGLGLDRPVDHLRMRANIRPFFPLAGTKFVLRSFISRGGNALLEVVDVQQGSWRGRVSARVMFGPDGRLMAQTCPLLQAGGTYLPIPFMSVVVLYMSDSRDISISREPIPEFALPKSVEPFTQRELCDVARTYVFDDER